MGLRGIKGEVSHGAHLTLTYVQMADSYYRPAATRASSGVIC